MRETGLLPVFKGNRRDNAGNFLSTYLPLFPVGHHANAQYILGQRGMSLPQIPSPTQGSPVQPIDIFQGTGGSSDLLLLFLTCIFVAGVQWRVDTTGQADNATGDAATETTDAPSDLGIIGGLMSGFGL